MKIKGEGAVVIVEVKIKGEGAVVIVEVKIKGEGAVVIVEVEYITTGVGGGMDEEEFDQTRARKTGKLSLPGTKMTTIRSSCETNTSAGRSTQHNLKQRELVSRAA